VALAPTRIVSAGLTARHPTGAYGRLGLFHIGDRPATEDGFLVAQGFTRLDATAGYRADGWELTLSGQNLTNAVWREAQFANVSRLKGETSCPAGTRAVDDGGRFMGCEDLHFTPGAPLAVQAVARAFF
jgi:outer membrane receptor protein involved in Fe transport